MTTWKVSARKSLYPYSFDTKQQKYNFYFNTGSTDLFYPLIFSQYGRGNFFKTFWYVFRILNQIKQINLQFI